MKQPLRDEKLQACSRASLRDPIMVANAVVSPSGVSALKIMLGGDSAALHIDTDAQISILGILATMSSGSAALRVKIGEIASSTDGAFDKFLMALGCKSIMPPQNDDELEKVEVEPQLSAAEETQEILSSIVDAVVQADGAAEVEVAAVAASPAVVDKALQDVDGVAPSSESTIDVPRERAIVAVGHIVTMLLNLCELDINRRQICETSPQLLNGVANVIGIDFMPSDAVEIKCRSTP